MRIRLAALSSALAVVWGCTSESPARCPANAPLGVVIDRSPHGMYVAHLGETVEVRGRVTGGAKVSSVAIRVGATLATASVSADGTFSLPVRVTDSLASDIQVDAIDCAGNTGQGSASLAVLGAKRLYLSVAPDVAVLHDVERADLRLSRQMLLHSRRLRDNRGQERALTFRMQTLDGEGRVLADLYIPDPLLQTKEQWAPPRTTRDPVDQMDLIVSIPDQPDARSVRLSHFDGAAQERSLGEVVLP